MIDEENGTIIKPSPVARPPRVITEIQPRYEAGKEIQRIADGLAQLAGVHGSAATQWVAEAIDAADRFYIANRGKTIIPESVVRAIKNGAGLNLSFNHTLGQLYLVPFKNGEFSRKNKRDTYECQLIVGYQGYEALAYGTGWLDTLYVECVTEEELRQDRFEWWIDESGPHIKHRPMLGRSIPRSIKDKEQIALAYVSYRTKTGNVGCAVADKGRIARAVNPYSDMWKFDFPAGAKKTAIREAAKHWPKSRLMGGALYLDDMSEIDQSQSDITATRIDAGPEPARLDAGPRPGEVAGLGDDDADDSPAFKALEYRIEGGTDETYPALRAAVKEAVFNEQITAAQGDRLRAAIDQYADAIPY